LVGESRDSVSRRLSDGLHFRIHGRTQMRVAIDQAGEDGISAQIDDRDVARRRRPDGIERADLTDLSAVHPDALVRSIRGRPHVEQAARAHEQRLRAGRLGPDRNRCREGKNKESEEPDAHARSLRR
jgi:hypothetical protein